DHRAHHLFEYRRADVDPPSSGRARHAGQHRRDFPDRERPRRHARSSGDGPLIDHCRANPGLARGLLPRRLQRRARRRRASRPPPQLTPPKNRVRHRFSESRTLTPGAVRKMVSDTIFRTPFSASFVNAWRRRPGAVGWEAHSAEWTDVRPTSQERSMHLRTTKIQSALIAAGVAAVPAMAAQAEINDSIRGAPSEANHFIATPEGWEHPKTPWGEPDIQAMLDMMQASRVPLERCASSFRFGAPPCDMTKAWLTEEEYNEALARWSSQVDVSRQALEEGNIALSLRTGLVDPNIPQRQTNLIFDPPNGLLPALTPEGKRLALQMGSDWALPGEDLTFDGPEDFDNWDRCITRGLPSSMMPYRYNGGFFIEQAPGYVIFRLEMIHEARVIPTTEVEALPPE